MAQQDPTLAITVDGQRHDIDITDIDGCEWAAVKKQTGLKPKTVIEDAVDMDFEAVAALLWIVRRRTEPGLVYDDVLRSLSLKAFHADGIEDGEADPPVSAGS